MAIFTAKKPSGTAAGLRGPVPAQICLLLVLLGLSICPPSEALECVKSKYKYGDSPDSECKGQEFWIQRCAASEEDLQNYMTGLQLEAKMQPNTCKLAWLMACSTFDGDAVVVPKSIKCNKFLCDQSGYYSNCETSEHCYGITSVQDGQPEAGTSWPLANHSKDGTTGMPYFRPCCDFYQKQCNGANCAQDDGCPIDVANKSGWCGFVKDRAKCWMPLLDQPRINSATHNLFSTTVIFGLIPALAVLQAV